MGTPWSEWGACDLECGTGVATRTRMLNGSTETENKNCNTEPCDTNWTEWGTCDRECGTGVSTRTRILNGSTETENKNCNTEPCDTDSDPDQEGCYKPTGEIM